jgi:hypothetical protein
MGDYAKILVRSVLFGSVKQNGENVPVYPSHMSGVKNPVFPCITLNKKGGTRQDTLADEDLLYISVWSKIGNDELWDIYNQVKEILNLKGIPGIVSTNYHSILYMREVYKNDNLYEKDTFTYQLASRYHVDMM